MTKQTFIQKSNGDTLEASEWNNLTSYVNTAVDAINAIPQTSANSGNGLPNMYINAKGNLNIETSSLLGNTSKGKINIESMNDIQFKPGDDIILYSHHREEGKQDEVAIKVTDGDDVPVKMQLNTSEILLTTKDKSGSNSNVMDVTVNSDPNTRGYLKVRAQAIDLRCEEHGGIALQPKGKDGQNHMNKIKFEHGGGDGLEFGTFNTEKTSIFTDEYRFNKDGVWKMATRQTQASDKADASDSTTAYKYVKQTDDFYDIIDNEDATTTTENIIKTSNAFNNEHVHTEKSNTGSLFVSTDKDFLCELLLTTPVETDYIAHSVESGTFTDGHVYTFEEINQLPHTSQSSDIDIHFVTLLSNTLSGESVIVGVSSQADGDPQLYFKFTSHGYDITMKSCGKLKLSSEDTLKIGGPLDFGSKFGFGETDEGIEFQYKLTKKNATKDCGELVVMGINNHDTNNLVVNDITIAPGSKQEIARCSILDIIKLVDYFKTGDGLNQGPWSTAANL